MPGVPYVSPGCYRMTPDTECSRERICIPEHQSRCLCALAGTALVSAALVAYAWREEPGVWEQQILRWVQAADPPGLRSLALLLTVLGEGPPWLLIVALLALALWQLRGPRWALLLVCVAALKVIGPLLKPLVMRARPEEPVAVWMPLSTYGFPSSHALGVMLVFGYAAIALEGAPLGRPLRRWLQAGCAGVTLLMGWARIYLGAHWPSDVLGGYSIGLTLLSATSVLLARVERWPGLRRARPTGPR